MTLADQVGVINDELKPNKTQIKTELEPCEDWYDVPSDEMTLEQARQAVKDLREKLAEYLEQQPCDDNWRFYYNHGYAQAKRDLSCEDCISRQEAINCVTLNEFRYKIVEDMKILPSVAPKVKTGHWIKVTNGRGGHECDLCHEYAPSYRSGDEYLTKYCPNCGARMVSE